MASSDFIYDLLDGLKQQDMDYLVIAIDKCKEQDSVELFFESRDENSDKIMIYSFEKLKEEIDKGLPEGELKVKDYGLISQEDLDEVAPPKDEDEEDDYR